MTNARMTRTEAADLQRVVRMNCKLARTDIDARAAAVLAEFEAQLAKEYDPQDAMVKDLFTEADKIVHQLNAELKQRCDDAGVPRNWAPSLHVVLYQRGENASAERRYELRRVAFTRMDEMKRTAKLAVDRAENAMATALIANQLDGAEAKEWLATLPSADSLIQEFSIAEIELAKDAGR